jgi:hypothetical protein
MLQDSASLFDRNPGKPLDELENRGVIFEVLEQGCDRHTRAPEDPCAAQDGGILFYGCATGPVDHAKDGSTPGCSLMSSGLGFAVSQARRELLKDGENAVAISRGAIDEHWARVWHGDDINVRS